MERRDLLRALGSATALALLPRQALAAWERVANGVRPAGGLTDAQLALIAAVSDTIIPRTDTPSATDVRVPAFVDIIVSENYSDAQRSAFLAGLDAIDSAARANGGIFADLGSEARGAVITSIESATDRTAEPSRTYWRLKGLVVHGYFTSERVMKDVLKAVVMPGKFDGAAPMPKPVTLTGSPRG
jgi:glucoside 3-dehydrogenase (cytochrome c) hitch-hiker subunit